MMVWESVEHVELWGSVVDAILDMQTANFQT